MDNFKQWVISMAKDRILRKESVFASHSSVEHSLYFLQKDLEEYGPYDPALKKLLEARVGARQATHDAEDALTLYLRSKMERK